LVSHIEGGTQAEGVRQ